MRHPPSSFFFFFNDTATTEIYTLSLHDALPILITLIKLGFKCLHDHLRIQVQALHNLVEERPLYLGYRNEEVFRRELIVVRSEEHTSELQSRLHLVCRLLLEKKKNRS